MNDRLMQEGEELTTVESKPERGKKQQPRLRGSVARDLNDCPAAALRGVFTTVERKPYKKKKMTVEPKPKSQDSKPTKKKSKKMKDKKKEPQEVVELSD